MVAPSFDSRFVGMFRNIREDLLKEEDTREKIRGFVSLIDSSTREAIRWMQVIHVTKDALKIHEAIAKAKENLAEIFTNFENLNVLIPEGQYYRYHDTLKYSMQQLSFVAALMIYMETPNAEVQIEIVANYLKLDELENIELDTEDYLMGLLNLASEMTRLAVNSVTLSDYVSVPQIAAFVNSLDGGFRLLSLKNTLLRKRYDALKYDVKRIEEVVYDLNLRGLLPQPIE